MLEYCVIGGTGFIAAYLVKSLLDKGCFLRTAVFIPSFYNYRIWSFWGFGMTTYTAWYLTIASLVHGQVEGVTHQGPTKLVLYFTDTTNILYTFGGHAVTMKLCMQCGSLKNSSAYQLATLYVFTLTIPLATTVYLAFGDQLFNHSNAFSLLPRSAWRDTTAVLMLIHQLITSGFACTPLYFVWEKVVGIRGETNKGLEGARSP